jgi:hypothetical protein
MILKTPKIWYYEKEDKTEMANNFTNLTKTNDYLLPPTFELVNNHDI